jgi:hypothetical protein
VPAETNGRQVRASGLRHLSASHPERCQEQAVSLPDAVANVRNRRSSSFEHGTAVEIMEAGVPITSAFALRFHLGWLCVSCTQMN